MHTPGLNANESISKRKAKHKEHMYTFPHQRRWIEDRKESIQTQTQVFNAEDSINKRMAKHNEHM